MTQDGLTPTVRRVRAYFAPVQRALATAPIFDPAETAAFDLEVPPAPWTDLGWISGFARSSSSTVVPIKTGSPASTVFQVRTDVEATVSLAFQSWGKLQLSLTAGTQRMNLLQPQSGATPARSGGSASPALAVGLGSTATAVNVGISAAAAFSAGSLVVVDVDYMAGTTGFVGSGVSGAHLKSGVADVDYVRRVSLNVGRVLSVANGVLTLQAPLIAGAPSPGMKVSSVVGFCDREGSSFFQEWAALFVGEGQQGERVFWHYPRLQAAAGIAEEVSQGPGGYEDLQLKGRFRALPVNDPLDGERVLCFRSFLPAA